MPKVLLLPEKLAYLGILPTQESFHQISTGAFCFFLFFLFFFVFFVSETIVSHLSKPTRGEAYELLDLEAEKTVEPLFLR